MISPDQGSPLDPRGIFERLQKAIAQAKASRAIVTAAYVGSDGAMLAALPTALFLGEEEWRELDALCTAWGVEWKGAIPTGYDPVSNDEDRAEFDGVKIYRVDAARFLAAT